VGGRTVGGLRVEVRIDVAEPDAAERGAAVADHTAARAGAGERHVGEDVLPLEETDLAAGEDLSPRSAHCEIRFAQVDLRTEVVVQTVALDLRREAEVHAEVEAAFLASGGERRVAGQ